MQQVNYVRWKIKTVLQIKGCDCDQIYYEVMKSVKKDWKKDTIKGLISKL